MNVHASGPKAESHNKLGQMITCKLRILSGAVGFHSSSKPEVADCGEDRGRSVEQRDRYDRPLLKGNAVIQPSNLVDKDRNNNRSSEVLDAPRSPDFDCLVVETIRYAETGQ